MEIYVVDEMSKKEERTWHGWNFKIKYAPGDEVYNPHNYTYTARQKRVSFKLYRNEVINFDAITLEECDYYIKNRLERPNYLSILSTLYYVRELKLEEEKLEAEFVEFMRGKLNWEPRNNWKIQRAVQWWKLKNKWKRDLMTDDAKAVRMIYNILRRKK
jgi:hypothetical protein